MAKQIADKRAAREAKLNERKLAEAQDVFVLDKDGTSRPDEGGPSIFDVPTAARPGTN